MNVFFTLVCLFLWESIKIVNSCYIISNIVFKLVADIDRNYYFLMKKKLKSIAFKKYYY